MLVSEPSTSDRILHETVCRHLARDPEISSNDISVSVTGGIVTLTGFVRAYREKLSAERTVIAAGDVRAVANSIRVVLEVERTGPEIAREAVDAIAMTAGISKTGITVTVRDGSIMLDGVVEWEFQRATAEAALHSLTGVTEISNRIEIRPPLSPAELRANLGRAACAARVEVQDRTVRLSGPVSSWGEREAAERAAWSTPGVLAVENELEVTI